MKLTIGRKLTLGFGAILLLIVGTAGLVYSKSGSVATLQNQVIELRAPTAMAGQQLITGINKSLAGLRGRAA